MWVWRPGWKKPPCSGLFLVVKIWRINGVLLHPKSIHSLTGSQAPQSRSSWIWPAIDLTSNKMCCRDSRCRHPGLECHERVDDWRCSKVEDLFWWTFGRMSCRFWGGFPFQYYCGHGVWTWRSTFLAGTNFEDPQTSSWFTTMGNGYQSYTHDTHDIMISHYTGSWLRDETAADCTPTFLMETQNLWGNGFWSCLLWIFRCCGFHIKFWPPMTWSLVRKIW